MRKTTWLWGLVAAGVAATVVFVVFASRKVTSPYSLDDPDPAIRAAVVRAAERDGDSALLIAALHDDDPDVRLLAVMKMARAKESVVECATALLAVLKDDRPTFRAQASESLGWLMPDAWPVLRSALKDDDPRVRAGVAGALARIYGHKGCPGMWGRKYAERILTDVEGLLADPEEEVRSEAAGAISRIKYCLQER